MSICCLIIETALLLNVFPCYHQVVEYNEYNLICHNSFTNKQAWLLILVQNMQKYNIGVTGERNRTCVPIDT
jgi:hypothetical protein